MGWKRLKKQIDQLDAAARKTTENNELFNLADTKRDMVYLDHTLKDQNYSESLDGTKRVFRQIR